MPRLVFNSVAVIVISPSPFLKLTIYRPKNRISLFNYIIHKSYGFIINFVRFLQILIFTIQGYPLHQSTERKGCSEWAERMHSMTVQSALNYRYLHHNLSYFVSKPYRKFSADMIYGILASGSCLLTDIVDQLHEKSKKVNSVERLTRHLNKGIPQNAQKSYLSFVRTMVSRNPIIHIDDSDVIKPEGRKFHLFCTTPHEVFCEWLLSAWRVFHYLF